MERLTKNFTLAELTRTSRALDNTPTAAAKANLKALCEKVLQPLRDAWGDSIIVTSGYRSAAVNKAVGGVPSSQHLSGEAADITAKDRGDNRRLFELAIKMGLPFDQLIDEKGYRWIHVSYSPRNRRNVLHLK